jgi:hypothetical protein
MEIQDTKCRRGDIAFWKKICVTLWLESEINQKIAAQ